MARPQILRGLFRVSQRSGRAYSTQQQSPPPNATTKPNPHREFYKGLGRPVAFNFLIALATFQALHWSWLKLESLETKQNTNNEIRQLEEELKGLTVGGKSTN